jgi:hypothetical protein
MRYAILALLLALISIPAHSGDVRMWRDEDGKLHFGDAPIYQSHRVVTTPSYRGDDNYRADSIVERAERAERKRREQEDYTYNQPNARGLSYEDDIRLRELRIEKGRLHDQLRRESNRPFGGNSLAIGDDIRGINEQIRDIERRR